MLYVSVSDFIFVGWVGHGFSSIFCTGWGRVEICGFGLGVGLVVAGWVGYWFGFPTLSTLQCLCVYVGACVCMCVCVCL